LDRLVLNALRRKSDRLEELDASHTPATNRFSPSIDKAEGLNIPPEQLAPVILISLTLRFVYPPLGIEP